MHPFYAKPIPRSQPSHRPHPMSAPQYHNAPHPVDTTSHNPPLSDFDKMIKDRYARGDSKLHLAISRLRLPPGPEQQLRDCVKGLRAYRNLFVQTFAHLASCCQARNMGRLLGYVAEWQTWGSVRQLAGHSLIRDPLVDFWEDRTCRQHKWVSSDDDSDLLCLLLYCSKDSGLYELPRRGAIHARGMALKESEQVVELLWQFLMQPQKQEDDKRRLRACIYRMARKSAYLPHDLQIRHSIKHQGDSLGAGGNGMVTKARMDGKDVAVKTIACGNRASQTKCIEMFASEAILWRTLQHKYIVPFFGVVSKGPDIGLVSPFYKNGHVRSYLYRCNPKQRSDRAKQLGRELAEALNYIHSHEPPIIHGDIKGDNVLVDDDGHARLGDFGQSYASDSGKFLDSSRVGLALCPLRWMAPEVILWREDGKASDKTDIYSFGCVLYEMVSGDIPFEGLSSKDLMSYVTSGGRPAKPGNVHDSLWRVVERCWAHRPEDRPSAEKLVRLLK